MACEIKQRIFKVYKMKRESNSFPSSTRDIRTWSVISMTALLMMGCGGGGSIEKTEDKPVMASAQTVETQKVAYGPIKPASNAKRSGSKAKVASSSFTVNPTENFSGFNPDVWNSRSSWTECNCSNTQSGPPPKIVTWNP
jgi:hypothetical protein